MLALGALAACAAAPEPAPERVLLVTIDTLRADRVGCYGAGRGRTPQLDALAEAGVRFRVAVSPAPLTLPAHASLMTALDPPAHGVRHNSIHRLGPDLPVLAEQMRDAGFATAAFVGALVLDARFGLARGFDVYDMPRGGRASARVGYAERRAGAVVDAALAWLETAPPRFFAWVHFYDPHKNYDPPAGFAAAFVSDRYAGEIAYADSQLGRLLTGVRARWGEGGLLLAVTSDHGESLGEHGELTHAYGVYEATQRIPLLLAGPGLPRGRVVEQPARLVDVGPTLLAMSGAEPLPDADGRDLRPLIAGSEGEPRVAYMETLATQLDFRWSPLLALRVGDDKYVRAPRPELYDLATDPGETRNRFASEPELALRLDRRLDRHLDAQRAPRDDVRLTPGERDALAALGYVVPDPGIARARLGVVGGTDPKDAIGLLDRLVTVQNLLARGRPHQAFFLLRALGDAGPSVAAQRAAAALAAGEPEAAEVDARAVLAEEPNRSDVHLLLGQALERLGRPAEAVRSFSAAAVIDPGAAAAWAGRGRSLEALGRVDEARAAYVRALEANPGQREAAERLAALGPAAAGDRPDSSE